MKPTDSHPKSRRVLLLVDFQMDFLADNGKMPVARNQVEPMIAAALKATEIARAQRDFVIFIGNEFRSTDYLMNFLRRCASMKGTPGSVWDRRLPLKPSDYFSKWSTSAFCNPAFENRLKADGISEIVLAGLKTSACISATAFDALRKGYRVAVLTEATADSSDRIRLRALRRLASRGVELRGDYPTLTRSGAESEGNRELQIQVSNSTDFEACAASGPLSARGGN